MTYLEQMYTKLLNCVDNYSSKLYKKLMLSVLIPDQIILLSVLANNFNRFKR